ncbi:MAG TPA: GMC family oxidoreductase [Candidatus Dormibacteraeota bacterium]|nr:GMC family oxidoreductase [Candidatus Dormibacteraeota bacterium]
MNPNPYASEQAKSWRIVDASKLDRDERIECDVAIVGSGAGGGTAAEILARAGLSVVILEEGPLKTSSDFHMLEREAYPELYQESAGRRTADQGIIILQGRSVGGSTTVNWTSSFRTPPQTLAYWREHFGLQSYTPDALAPWFAMMEQRLGVHPWAHPPNENNDILRRGAAKVGVPTAVIPRNVRGCYNLGYCGVGCPTNAKQSMLVTTIPSALAHGARLYSRVRAERFVHHANAVRELECSALDAAGLAPGPHRIIVSARVYIAAGGAINTPGLLLRSALPDPHARIGKRTFLHPTVISSAIMPEEVLASSGAPQSIYSDHFLYTQPFAGPIGYKLEVPPLQPVLTAATFTGMGPFAASVMERFNRLQAIIALMRDGFHPESVGGSVSLRSDSTPILDYPVSEYLWAGMRRAFLSMAEIQFAAGASAVMPQHESARPYRSWAQAKAGIAALPMEILRTRVASAHVMGGSAMSRDEREGVIDERGRSHAIENLYVFDGSAFPTSLGVNPQLSIYGMVSRNASELAASLTGHPATMSSQSGS